ncbi:MAG: hypothetical protein ACI86M_003121 [Saprospiraceae bacterium]|jgi:hypothetical protein
MAQQNTRKLQPVDYAANRFGLPTSEMTEQKFLHDKSIDVFSFGRPTNGLDIMLNVKGLNFKKCFDLLLKCRQL